MTGDLIPISDEQAKAIQEIVKAVRGLGGFIEKALGSTPENLVAYLFGDRLAIRRAENFARLMDEARQRLEERGIRDPRRPSLSVALPIIRAAADEDREELVDLWARLLADAMDPNSKKVRYSFIEAVKAMDPMDAPVLSYIHRFHGSNVSVATVAQHLSVRQDEVEISTGNLNALGLLNNLIPTAKGREFMRACYPEQK